MLILILCFYVSCDWFFYRGAIKILTDMDDTGLKESTEELTQETKQELYQSLASNVSLLSENLFDHAALSRLSKQEVDPEESGTHQLTIALTISLAISSGIGIF